MSTVEIEGESISPEDYNNAAGWIETYGRRSHRELAQLTLTSPNKGQHGAGYHAMPEEADKMAALAPISKLPQRASSSGTSTDRRGNHSPPE
ncbi:hypothetical protein HPB48_011776 [Haemaphysalis longicornis]|uniref:Uncharacterized protein n=1 Tax=Haemaphysalis longicornis TaxID=44386 RepID=A0A9J6GMS6_HAELO|nr:hypothetical protein HPB48_011776 [Haemaphysalis longicornis]